MHGDAAISIHDVTLSTDPVSTRVLTGSASRFRQGVRQIFLRFGYRQGNALPLRDNSLLEDGSPVSGDVQVVWKMDGRVASAETYSLSAPAGSCVYCLVREDGLPLPNGRYSVGIYPSGGSPSEFTFEIF
ncbi:MAG: hypothetical protein LBR38_07900 [Synergistaceae bacterium]|jgi:hypothetical protein|nr:hypothetical protein [Synergistaceae bacterium]